MKRREAGCLRRAEPDGAAHSGKHHSAMRIVDFNSRAGGRMENICLRDPRHEEPSPINQRGIRIEELRRSDLCITTFAERCLRTPLAARQTACIFCFNIYSRAPAKAKRRKCSAERIFA